MDHIDVVIIGAGVIGLATAREIVLQNKSVLLIEKEKSFGMATSSRNSEVIHAGIYYPTGSLKAKYCLEGNHLLYAYAKDRGIAFNNYGKLIVATNEQENLQLEKIWQRAQDNGVKGMQRKTAAEIHALEPELNCTQAIYSGTTGIIDSHAYMLSLLGDFENAGGMIAYQTRFLGASPAAHQGRLIITCNSDDQVQEQFQLSCDTLINAAGLGAVEVAKKIIGIRPESIPENYFVKGNYFSLMGKTPFRHLIYPVPEQAGLGVHLTLDLNGRAKFGPDVEYLETKLETDIDYSVNPERVAHFENQIRQYWPGLPNGTLSPDYSGVRPKIQYDGQVWGDFKIDDEPTHGVAGLINLFGFESPGLTASLAAAKEIYSLIK